MDKFKLNLGGRELTIEASDLAEQANGNVLARYGDTLVLSTCVMSKENREGLNFFPLTVDYEERYYAAGKIRGPRYIKRESRPSDEAIILARLIDRTIRPLFPKKLKREVQAINTCLSWDGANDPDILGLIATSTSLSSSDIPWSGPVGILRVGRVNGNFILNPTYEEREKSDLDLVIAGEEDKNDVLINMIEAGCQEIDEKTILEAAEFGKKHLKEIIEFQKEIVKKIGKEKITLVPDIPDLELEKEIKEFLGNRLEQAIYFTPLDKKLSNGARKQKQGRTEEIDTLKKDLSVFVEEKYPGMGKGKYAFDFLEKELGRIVHQNIIQNEKRPDGRKIDELREISCEVGLLPRTHGSGLFIRGQTKALSILTLGAPGDQQILEGMEIVGKKRFMHHYNFPPYCSGEIKPMRGPGRREIGHGILAEKALLPLVPTFEEFPYTIRVVTEILSSNGSTSMASVSSSSLALMDAGVPIKRPGAGISIGLMADGKEGYKLLTDIQGPEDHYGDMDFKIAGTRKGIIALQMDVKIEGVGSKILAEALERGRKARNQILDKIEKVIAEPRKELSPWAPRIYVLQINPDKIREVIGPGGKVINAIIGETGVSIDIEDSGKILITSEKKEAAEKALEWINNITREVKVGEIFQGKVKRILDFGAFVEILPGQDGLIHISQLAPYRVNKVGDIVKIGDVVPVKVISIDEQGRINLSLKEAKGKS